MHFVLLIALLLVNGAYSSNKPILDLDKSIELGLRNNTNLRSLALEKDLDTPGILAGIGQFLPNLTVSYNADESDFYNQTYINADGTVTTLPAVIDGRAIDVQEGKRRSSQYAIRSELVVFDGFRNVNTLRTALLTQKSRNERFQLEIAKLRLAIVRGYTNLSIAQKRVSLANESIQQQRLHLEYANARFESGLVSKRDVMSAEVNLGRALIDSIGAEIDFKSANENFNLLIGLPVDSFLYVADLPEIKYSQVNKDEMLGLATEKRIELLLSKMQLQSNRLSLQTARGEYLPRLSFNLTQIRSEQSGANVDFTTSPRNRNTTIGMTVSLPIFSRFSRVLQVQDAKVRLKQNRLHAEEQTRLIHQEVNNAVESLSALNLQLEIAEKTLELASVNLEFEQERYRLGIASIIELGFAQLSYTEAAANAIRLRGMQFIALHELDYVVGGNHWRQ